MRFLFLLLLAVAPAVSRSPLQVHVRVVSFEKSGSATALEAAAPGCDETLYAGLVADTAAGRAKRMQDQSVIVRDRQRSKVEAIQAYPSPTESDAEPSDWVHYPSSFSVNNLGQTVEAEASVAFQDKGSARRLIDINLAPECSSLMALHPWPVPDFRGSGQMGRMLRPVFAVHKSTTQVLTWTGRTVLLSVVAGPQTSMTDDAEPSFRYTFLRAGLDGEKPALAGAIPAPANECRLHAVSIRLPRDEAAAILLEHAGDDAALYAQMCQLITGGSAILSGHSAIICRQGQRSKIESISRFSYCGGYRDLIPDSWSEMSPGCELEVEAQRGRSVITHDESGRMRVHYEPSSEEDGEGTGGRWNWAFVMREAPELVPYYPSVKHPALHGAAPEHVERKFTSRLRIPASGVLCSGVLSTAPATDEADAPGGLTDVCFVLQSPLPGKPGTDPQPHILLQSLILSVPAAEGPALAESAKSGDAIAPLIERLHAGELSCVAHAALVILRGQSGKAECVRHVQQPGDFRPSEVAPEISLPASWSSYACGITLTAEYFPGKEGITVDVTLEWDTAPVLPFGEPGARTPDISARRCTQEILLRKIHLTKNQPLIADVRASNAREGTPEHGRWHVLILLAR